MSSVGPNHDPIHDPIPPVNQPIPHPETQPQEGPAKVSGGHTWKQVGMDGLKDIKDSSWWGIAYNRHATGKHKGRYSMLGTILLYPISFIRNLFTGPHYKEDRMVSLFNLPGPKGVLGKKVPESPPATIEQRDPIEESPDVEDSNEQQIPAVSPMVERRASGDMRLEAAPSPQPEREIDTFLKGVKTYGARKGHTRVKDGKAIALEGGDGRIMYLSRRDLADKIYARLSPEQQGRFIDKFPGMREARKIDCILTAVLPYGQPQKIATLERYFDRITPDADLMIFFQGIENRNEALSWAKTEDGTSLKKIVRQSLPKVVSEMQVESKEAGVGFGKFNGEDYNPEARYRAEISSKAEALGQNGEYGLVAEQVRKDYGRLLEIVGIDEVAPYDGKVKDVFELFLSEVLKDPKISALAETPDGLQRIYHSLQLVLLVSTQAYESIEAGTASLRFRDLVEDLNDMPRITASGDGQPPVVSVTAEDGKIHLRVTMGISIEESQNRQVPLGHITYERGAVFDPFSGSVERKITQIRPK